MFGTRLNGRDVHASARYINTKLSPSLGCFVVPTVGAFGAFEVQPGYTPPKKKGSFSFKKGDFQFSNERKTQPRESFLLK